MLESESYLKEIIYITLLGDLQLGFMAELEAMEVGSLGHFSSASGNNYAALSLSLSLSKKAISCPKGLSHYLLIFFCFGGSYTA